jgi:cobalt-zinc-cadmium efflux system outer membrane protein
MSTKKGIALLALALVVSGCASINPQQGFDEVSSDVEQGLGSRVYWYTGSEEDTQVQQSIQNLIAQPLTADSAVQIALLNNQLLQAEYANLGISQADLLQAGLLKNPKGTVARLARRSELASDGINA